MTIKFWGVRGSIPSPGPWTVRYGGNTPCVSVELGTNKMLVLDAGTGIRELGKAIESEDKEIFILLTHIHWDHIQGFPFFAPLYQSTRKIYIFPLQVERMLCPLIEQIDGAHFPMTSDNITPRCHFIRRNAMGFLSQNGFRTSRIAINHRGGGYGYRIANAGRSVVYLTDNELDPPRERRSTDFDGFVRFCKGADVLIHDAQYVDQDMPCKRGWGHSLVSQACALAAAAEVKHLVLFHHDPDRSDDELDLIQERARSWFRENNHEIRCTAAFEGLSLNLYQHRKDQSRDIYGENFVSSNRFLFALLRDLTVMPKTL